MHESSPIKATSNRRVMQEVFLFNSPPRSGNVFLMFLFRTFIGYEVNKCLEIEKYSDKSQKQAVFFRNPYNSIPSAIFKARVDTGLSVNEEDIENLEPTVEWYTKQYLEAIREAKANQSNIYLGISEEALGDPISAITDIALFFGFELQNKQLSNNNQIIEEIKQRMYETEKTRVDESGQTIVENLMTDHDGHLPREKSSQRISLDNLIKDLDLDSLKECYNEYMSVIPTNAKEGQRWVS
jgi:hypothetical protein